MSAPLRSGDHIPTGTGSARRRLTVAEAKAGGLPAPFTAVEWSRAFVSSACYAPRDAKQAAAEAVLDAMRRELRAAA